MAAGVALAALAACDGPAGRATASLSWRFADGRACDLAGVVHVAIHGAGPREVVALCRDGEAPGRAVEVVVESTPAEIDLRGTTLDGAVLYAGRTRVERSGPTTVSLGFVGGE
jgi:hypothetical protein